MNFRRTILALACLALFTGLASAQVAISGTPQGGPLSCTASVAVPPQLRAEGMTELVGDILLTCSGGGTLAQGATVPTVNITVSLGTNVTSRILNSTTSASEALLLIDEPGSTNAAGPGPSQVQSACSTPLVGAGATGCVVTVSGDAWTPRVNTFQGVVSGNQVVFNGIPVMAPVTAGSARVFRLTNIRANASALGGGSFAGTTQLLASISISGSTSLPVNNPVVIAGFIQSGLTTGLAKASDATGFSVGNFRQCSSASTAAVGLLSFKENFATAFKTRVSPSSPGASGNALSGSAIQNNPGFVYNSESGFITSAVANAGLADYGTRLKAVFNNVPAGVRLFVSTQNLTNITTAPASPLAQLILNETTPDSNGFLPAATATGTTSASNGSVNYAEIPVVNGTGMAVWEVISTNTSSSETILFGVWTTYSANPGANSPAPGTATVNLSYAPTPTAAFSAAAGSSASASLTVPRFADTSSANNLLNVISCATVLLYPFVTNQGGFDTGIAIANTTTDPLGTKPQNGSCNLNWYGSATNPPVVSTGNIATGTVYTTLASTSAAGFQGYMIAVCNFSMAHGFAFVSDIGARNIAMGYLPLILSGSATSRDLANAEQLVH